MNEKSNTAARNNGAGERGCERAEELVAYLYGESAPTEAKAFRQHLTSCAVCRDELAAFGGVREALGEWRADVLSAVPALGIGDAYKTESARPSKTEATPYAPERRRSAVAALREFFTLSPLWLQAGALAAVLVVCTLSALTLARSELRWDSNGLAFRTGIERAVVKEQMGQTTASTGYTQEQVEGMIAAERAKWDEEKNRQFDVMKAKWEQADAQRNANGQTLASQPRSRSKKRASPGNSVRSRQNANEDLAGVPDVFNTNEERVPRLTDILGAVRPKANER